MRSLLRRCGLTSAAAVLLGAGFMVTTQAGPIDPPAGAVASTYKTLSEIEPRTIISAANTPGNSTNVYRITTPGSYYLDRTLLGVAGRTCISIESDHVTLDLNGFSIQGVGGSLDGIFVNGGRRNVAIRNGTIRGFGGAGIVAVTINGGLFTDLILQGNVGEGMFVGSECVLTRVQAISNQGDGFSAMGETQVLFQQCLAVDNDVGFYCEPSADCTFVECSARSNREHGFHAGVRGTLMKCQARGNAMAGIWGDDRTTAIDCQSELNAQEGFRVRIGSRLDGCRSSDNGGRGFLIWSQSTMVDCSATFNLVGIEAQGGFSSLRGCSVASSTSTGVMLGADSSTERCDVRQSGGVGIAAGDRCTITSCDVSRNTLSGVTIPSECIVRSSSFTLNGTAIEHAGVFATGNNNQIIDNIFRVTSAFPPGSPGIGGSLGITGNTVARNISRGLNSYAFPVPSNDIGPYGTAQASTSPWANISN